MRSNLLLVFTGGTLALVLPFAACVSSSNPLAPPAGDASLPSEDSGPGFDASADDSGRSLPDGGDSAVPFDAGNASDAADAADANQGFDAASLECTDAGTGRCLVVLADNQSNPTATAIDPTDTHVYWVEEGLPGGLHSVPVNGGAIATLATNQQQTNAIAVNGTSIYWANDANSGAILMAPLTGVPDGGAPTTIVAGVVATSLALDSMSVYWVSFGDGTVMKAPLAGVPDGGAPTLIAASQGGLEAIAVDGTSVYWTTAGSGAGGAVMSAPLAGVPDGGAATVLAANQTSPFGLAADSTSVYWTTDSATGALLKAPLAGLDGGAPTTIASGLNNPSGVAIDGTDVYWATTPSSGTGFVMRAPIAGGGTVVTLATGQTTPNGLVVDANNVYWSNFAYGRVLQMPKAP